MKKKEKVLSNLRCFCLAFFSVFMFMFFSSCSIKKMAFNAVANGMAPSYKQKVKERERVKKLKEKGIEVPNPMLAFLGEDDVELVEKVFPFIIKMYEMMMLQEKNHEGLALMTGEFYVMYANAFVESPAVFLPDVEYDKKHEQFGRARKLYLRGYNLVLNALNILIPGFKDVMLGTDEGAIDEVLKKCGKEHVEHLYWAGVAVLAAFAIEPMNTETSYLVYAGRSMLEKASEIEPFFNNGALWEALTKFYAASPESLGGGEEKAMIAYQKAFEASNGENPSIYVTYASSFCIPKQDEKGFDDALNKALAIDAKANKENVLMFTISQNYAKWLKAHKRDFILGN